LRSYGRRLCKEDPAGAAVLGRRRTTSAYAGRTRPVLHSELVYHSTLAYAGKHRDQGIMSPLKFPVHSCLWPASIQVRWLWAEQLLPRICRRAIWLGPASHPRGEHHRARRVRRGEGTSPARACSPRPAWEVPRRCRRPRYRRLMCRGLLFPGLMDRAARLWLRPAQTYLPLSFVYRRPSGNRQPKPRVLARVSSEEANGLIMDG